MGIFFNPNLRQNDALPPSEIEAKVAKRNEETRNLAKQAYETGGVPESSAQRAADHSSVSRQTSEGKKARKDARTWFWAKQPCMEINTIEADDDD
jgi:hypothetical protein